jgi:hypothetical protein
MHCVSVAEGTFLILSQPWSESDSFFIREATTNNIEPTIERGRALWDSIYQPHADKLHDKLGSYHPDFISKSISYVHVPLHGRDFCGSRRSHGEESTPLD